MREPDFAFANQVRAAAELRTPRTSRMLLAAVLLLLISGTTWAHFAILDEVTDLVFNGYRNGFDLTQLVSHRFPLEQAVEAIEVASHPKADSMKIMVEPVAGSGAE